MTRDATPGGRARFEELLLKTHQAEGVALYLVPGQAPRVRAALELRVLVETPLEPADVAAMARDLFGGRLEQQARRGCATTVVSVESASLLARVTLSTALGAPTITARLLTTGPAPSLEKLDAPPVVEELAREPWGLVLVVGPHASGKTATLLSLVDWINRNHAVSVCTVEETLLLRLDPVRSLLTQREVGTDVPDAVGGIEAAMEHDLDVLAISAALDAPGLLAALRAAETGHLVFLQVHANDAREALVRLVEAVPEDLRPMVRRALAGVLRGAISQRLLPRQPRGRVAVHEVLIPDEALLAAIGKGEPLERHAGSPRSVSMHERLDRLEAQGAVSGEDAARLRAQLR